MTADKAAATWHPGDGPVKPLDLDAIRAPLPDDARMDAYYYGFDRTGVGVVDAILSAVAVAGKASHHTESWGGQADYEDWGYHCNRPGLVDGNSPVDQIQQNAARAANAVRALLAALAAETARADQAEQRIADAPHHGSCRVFAWGTYLRTGASPVCTCWKSATPTTEQ